MYYLLKVRKMNRPEKKATEELERWSKEIKRGAASLAILSILQQKPRYGYDIVRRLSDLATTLMNLEQGTVYPLLRRLEKRGMLQAEWNYDDPQKPKKYYAISPDGQTMYKDMITIWTLLTNEIKQIIKEGSQ
jgi:DNA-binding PadR family transcriptional regulator